MDPSSETFNPIIAHIRDLTSSVTSHRKAVSESATRSLPSVTHPQLRCPPANMDLLLNSRQRLVMRSWSQHQTATPFGGMAGKESRVTHGRPAQDPENFLLEKSSNAVWPVLYGTLHQYNNGASLTKCGPSMAGIIELCRGGRMTSGEYASPRLLLHATDGQLQHRHQYRYCNTLPISVDVIAHLLRHIWVHASHLRSGRRHRA